MRYFTRAVSALLILTLLASGCAVQPGRSTHESPLQEATSESKDTLRVVSTLFPPYDFARQIAGDTAQISLLLPPGSESHTYEPTPQDILRIQNCDVFLYIGGESETWVDRVLDSMDTTRMRIVRLMDCVTAVEEELIEGMQHTEEEHMHGEEHGEEHGEDDDASYDEHIWTSPRNAILMVQEITRALIAAAPAHAAAYQHTADAYVAQLQALDATFTQLSADASRHMLVFGDRFPFRYFADAYGFKYYAAFPGCAEGAEPSAATVAFLIDRVREQHIPVVFYIEFSNERMADTICEATGAKKLLLHSCHNVSRSDLQNGATYISLMQQNAINLQEAVS